MFEIFKVILNEDCNLTPDGMLRALPILFSVQFNEVKSMKQKRERKRYSMYTFKALLLYLTRLRTNSFDTVRTDGGQDASDSGPFLPAWLMTPLNSKEYRLTLNHLRLALHVKETKSKSAELYNKKTALVYGERLPDKEDIGDQGRFCTVLHALS